MLDRLTGADYSTGDSYTYGYDATGNRLSLQSVLAGVTATAVYTYDDANRLETVNGVAQSFDANGNLLSDGVHTYTYDSANRLSTSSGGGPVTSNIYDGLGNRLQQTVGSQATTYVLDQAAGLTQVLDDGTNSYLYGNGRIAQIDASTSQYFLGDALGSVRQLTGPTGAVTLAQSYDPYGTVTSSIATAQTTFGFTSEQTDSATGLINLRARMYDPTSGRFVTKDSWEGDYNTPLSLNPWNYTDGNPVNLADPSGYDPYWCEPTENHPIDSAKCYLDEIRKRGLSKVGDANPTPTPTPTPTCTPTSTPEDPWQTLGTFNLSAYYSADETQYYSGNGTTTTVASLGNLGVNKYFLLSEAGVCTEGFGRLRGGKYVQCLTHLNWDHWDQPSQTGSWSYHMPTDKHGELEQMSYWGFVDAPAAPKYVPFDTVAICSTIGIPHDGSIEIKIDSDDLMPIIHASVPTADNIFTVTDSGGGLCLSHPIAIDVYIGQQPSYREDPNNSFYNKIASPIINIDTASVKWRKR